MKRPASAENNLERIRAWRAICPEITIRSTFITGFPGETEAEFEELLEFIEEARLGPRGCFAYSRSTARPPTHCRAPCRTRCARSAAAA